ncbi:MAG: methionyl-tRNA formyltransferase [Verrucomicrobiota bacterium]
MRILFMGTAELASPCLTGIASQVVHVITQPDRPKGRSLQLTPPPVKVTAGKLGLPVSQPAQVRDAVAEIRALHPDLIVVVAYGQILPQAILDIPVAGSINVHTSLLPRWRGASPIQSAILAGDSETGVTTMYMDEKMDHGDIILQRREPIRADDTSASLHDRLAQLGAALLSETVNLHERPRRQQDESQVTYARKFTKEDGQIDWTKPAVEIERQIRAFNPWPGAYTDLAGTRVKVWQAEVTASGTLQLLEVQPAGGKRMSFADFQRGHKVS